MAAVCPKSTGCFILGTDGRRNVTGTRSYPWSSVAHLFMSFSGSGSKWPDASCSAAMVDNNYALTAAHCIYDRKLKKWADWVLVIPGSYPDGSYWGGQPHGSTYADYMYMPTSGWKDRGDLNDDIALVRLRRPLGRATGWLGYGAFSDRELRSWSLNTAGYPCDKPANQMIADYAKVSGVTAFQVETQLDVCKGQSGSAAYVLFGKGGIYKAGRYAVGAVSHAHPGLHNDATRITGAIFRWMGRTTAICQCTSGACCDGCDYKARGTVCRVSAGPCDVAETCTGRSAACPADGYAPSSKGCRARAGPCDVAERCSGRSAACPADRFGPPSWYCRLSAGPCDVAERCSGRSAACPADGFAPATKVCRASAGPCDVEERCSGRGPRCGPDAFAPAGKVCRRAGGDCVEAGRCSGSSGLCPTRTRSRPDGIRCAGGGVCRGGRCTRPSVDGGPCPTGRCGPAAAVTDGGCATLGAGDPGRPPAQVVLLAVILGVIRRRR